VRVVGTWVNPGFAKILKLERRFSKSPLLLTGVGIGESNFSSNLGGLCCV